MIEARSFLKLLILRLSWPLWLQRGDTQLVRVRKLHRCLTFRPTGRHGVQLSASQSHVPGSAVPDHVGSLLFWCVSLCIHSSLLLSPSFSLLLMWFQAINKGPSRLLGSTVDIRIPNRLVGNGADMFHIIESQVHASGSLCYLCSPEHYLLVYSPTSHHIFIPHLSAWLLFMAKRPGSTSEDVFMFKNLLICGGSVRSHGVRNSEGVDVATEASWPFCFTTFCI